MPSSDFSMHSVISLFIVVVICLFRSHGSLCVCHFNLFSLHRAPKALSTTHWKVPVNILKKYKKNSHRLQTESITWFFSNRPFMSCLTKKAELHVALFKCYALIISIFIKYLNVSLLFLSVKRKIAVFLLLSMMAHHSRNALGTPLRKCIEKEF